MTCIGFSRSAAAEEFVYDGMIWSASMYYVICIEGLNNQFDNLQSSRVGQEAYCWPKECAAYGTRLWEYGSMGVWDKSMGQD